jgi:hypothetical protein
VNTTPTSFVLSKPSTEPVRPNMSAEESDPQTSCTLSTQPVRTDSTANKKKGTELQQLYQPPVPFPQRLAKAKLDEQFQKFMQVLKQLQITIPFTDALA